MKKTEKNTGIEFKAEKVTVVAPRTKIHGLGFHVLFLFFMAGLYGTFYTFSSAFLIEFDENIMFWGILLIGLFLWALYFSGRYGRILLAPAVVLAALLWFCRNAGILKNQVIVVMNAVREAANQYFVMELEPFETDLTMDSSVTELLLLVMLFIGLLLLLGLVMMQSRVLVLTVTILPTIGAMIVGLMPSFWPLALLAFCYIGSFSLRGSEFSHRKEKVRLPGYYKRGVEGRSALLMGFAAAAVFGISCLLMYPGIDKVVEEATRARVFVQQNSLIEMARDYFPKLRLSLTGAGQIDSGELGGDISFTGEEALQVTLYRRPGETIYLKGFSGSDYLGRRWKRDDDMEFFRENTQGDPDEARRKFFEQPFERAAMINSYLGQDFGDTMVLENKAAAPENVFAPYISRQEEAASNQEYAFSFFERGDFVNLLLMGQDWNQGQGDSFTRDYRDYVYGKYLSYPKENLGRLQRLCDENPRTDLDTMIDFVVSTVSGGAEYTLQPGDCPADKDFAEYFLFENKQGYCVHFATTAVLMFRMYGIPARYATGYIVQEQDFTENQSGELVAHIKDEKAHAWAEIYIDGEGWIPVEVTPGYVGGANPAEMAEPETKGVQRPDNQAVKPHEESPKPMDIPETEGFWTGKMSGRIVLLALFTVLAAAAFSTVLVIRRRLVLKRRERDDIRQSFEAMYEVLVLAGLSKRLDGTEENFAREAVKVLPGIDQAEFQTVMELVMQANYGNGEMVEEDTRRVREMYKKVCDLAYERLSGIEKIEFKYFKVFG